MILHRSNYPGRRALPAAGQQGSALAISLVFLLIMTLLGLSVVEMTTLEERMAGNFRDENLAFQAAEAAMRAAETRLRGGALPAFDCSAGFYRFNDLNCDGVADAAKVSKSVDWASTSQTVAVNDPAFNALAEAPVYIVEQMDAEVLGDSLEGGVGLDSNIYRITTHGTGGSSSSVVLLQSTFIP